ncbi:hypothetical protein BS47DRAFT_435679 [Hydnum rufescens UP504]|uniref:Cytochrome P450 n=1 Tax=Hydnum rufescens UP504 TaxID=1448309 RepID=A0A9P6AIE7_9AGAM|nr:hypothetical protein BS47DRAFT_435679 [Hydnum rufescens UP504]
MNKGALPQYFPTVEQESRRCLRRLHRNPENWMDELRLNTARVILGITYDIWDVESVDDERVTAANKLIEHAISVLTPGLLWMNTFPVCCVQSFWSTSFTAYYLILHTVRRIPPWVPWLGNENRLVSAWGEEDRTTIPKPFNYVKMQKNAGTARRSFVLSLLEEGATDEQTMIWLAASMWGADTTLALLYAFVLAMVLHPDAQKKAQEEIERVVGSERLPGIQDRGSLPYVHNLMREVFRWRSFGAFALGHRLMENDEYKGYFIPKGTIVLPCLWCISRDEEMYPEPETFRPERFDEVGPNGQLPLDPLKFSFSMGRRSVVLLYQHSVSV